jgi:hypothetical protein
MTAPAPDSDEDISDLHVGLLGRSWRAARPKRTVETCRVISDITLMQEVGVTAKG